MVRSISDADRAGDEEGQRHRDQQRVVEQGGIAGADHLLHHEGGVGPDHHHLAMRHVDDAHHAEGDGKADRREQQHRAERQAVPGVLHDRPYRQPALDRGVALAAAARDRRPAGRRRPAGQQRERLLVAAGLDGGDGFELVGVGGIRLEQQDRRARFGEGQLRGLVGFLRQRAVDRRQHRLIMGLEHRLRGCDALGRIGRQQRQAAERGLHGAAQPVVEANGVGAVGKLSTGSAGRGVDRLAVGLVDIDLLGVGSAIRRPSCSALMIAKASGLPDAATSPMASSVSEKSSVANLATASSNGPAKAGNATSEQKDRQSERTKAHVKESEHWTTPAGEVEKAAARRLLRSWIG